MVDNDGVMILFNFQSQKQRNVFYQMVRGAFL